MTAHCIATWRRCQAVIEWFNNGFPIGIDVAGLAGIHCHRRMRGPFIGHRMTTGSKTRVFHNTGMIKRRIQHHPIRIGMADLAGIGR